MLTQETACAIVPIVMKHVVIPCREPHCQNVLVLHPDSRLPQGQWTRPACEDALEEQMAEELSRRPTTPTKESAV
jgi:hypothetical protein